MLKVILVDDQKELLNALHTQLKQLPYVKVVCATTDAVASQGYFLNTPPHVAILDIDMPQISGISLAEWLQVHVPDVKVIFCTSHGSYIKDAFRVYAYDFIEKPIDYDRLAASLLKLDQSLGTYEQVTLTTETGQVFVPLKDICAVEAQGKHAVVYTTSASHQVKECLGDIENLLTGGEFFKSSRSHLVNLKQVTGIEKLTRTSFLVLFNYPNAYAQLSKKCYDEFAKALTHYHQ